MDEEHYVSCPHCGNEEFDGFECYECGFADTLLNSEYETPEGNIVFCSEDTALKEGYIYNCPVCNNHTIMWWEKEDIGMCIECWHKKHKESN